MSDVTDRFSIIGGQDIVEGEKSPRYIYDTSLCLRLAAVPPQTEQQVEELIALANNSRMTVDQAERAILDEYGDSAGPSFIEKIRSRKAHGGHINIAPGLYDATELEAIATLMRAGN